MLYCKFCGKEIQDRDYSCPHCKRVLVQSAEQLPEVHYKIFPAPERTCAQCGNTLESAVRFCSHCGAENEPQQAKRLPYCLFCGEMLHESANYCILCGTKYAESEDGYIEIPIELACDNCGEILPENTLFCMKCGSPVPKNRKIKLAVPCCQSCSTPLVRGQTSCEACKKTIEFGHVQPIEDGEYITCPICGEKRMKKGRKVCWGCGAQFTTE